MKLIKLTQGYNAKVDDADYAHINKYKWFVNGAHKKNQYARSSKKGLMHRYIMGIGNTKLQVDHIDHDTLNNQKSNLRLCYASGNARNTSSRYGSSSKYLGVTKTVQKYKNRKYIYYVAHIGFDKNQKYLGSFKNEIDAAKAYNDAAIKYHKEFANLNKIDSNMKQHLIEHEKLMALMLQAWKCGQWIEEQTPLTVNDMINQINEEMQGEINQDDIEACEVIEKLIEMNTNEVNN